VKDLNALLTIAQEAVEIGRKLMTTSGPGEVHAKGDRDLVTDLDLQIQREIRAYLQRATPDIDFLGEEEGGGVLDQAAEYVWALDPIDGTSNFTHGIPLCATQLALVRLGEPIVAVIVFPHLGFSYHAIKGGGAFRNNNQIHASSTTELRHAIVSIGDYATGSRAAEKNKRRLSVTEALVGQFERIRMFGTAALDLAFLAEGRTDACVILSNKPWDTAGGVLLAREAGAYVVDSSGRQHTFSSTEAIGAAKGIAKKLIDLVN
jgi:myo-inositol-1(or 4)-monophosphatase